MDIYREAIVSDNETDNYKEVTEVKLDKNLGKLEKNLDLLEFQKEKLENGEEVLNSFGEVLTLREVLYEMKFLKDTKISLNDLKGDIEKKRDFDIDIISKYNLSNYKIVLPKGGSVGVARTYRDISSLGLSKIKSEKGNHKITGYIDYVSMVDGNFIQKDLVILEKKVYQIIDGELFLDESFEIGEDNISIVDLTKREDIESDKKFLEKEVGKIEKGQIIDEEVEEEFNNILEKINPEVLEIIEELMPEEGIDEGFSEFYSDEKSNIDFGVVMNILNMKLDVNTKVLDVLTVPTRQKLAHLDRGKKDKILKEIEKKYRILNGIGGEEAKIRRIQLLTLSNSIDRSFTRNMGRKFR